MAFATVAMSHGLAEPARVTLDGDHTDVCNEPDMLAPPLGADVLGNVPVDVSRPESPASSVGFIRFRRAVDPSNGPVRLSRVVFANGSMTLEMHQSPVDVTHQNFAPSFGASTRQAIVANLRAV